MAILLDNNFGNDITIVNDCLGPNGLIYGKNTALEVHRWFVDNMPDDNHVIGSRLFTVYDRIAQQGTAADRHEPHNVNLNHDAQARRQG